jgi:hypothetical protein
MTKQPTVKRCKICQKAIEGFGHNADPVAKGRACTDCNETKVIPARFAAMYRAHTFPTVEEAK